MSFLNGLKPLAEVVKFADLYWGFAKFGTGMTGLGLAVFGYVKHVDGQVTAAQNINLTTIRLLHEDMRDRLNVLEKRAEAKWGAECACSEVLERLKKLEGIIEEVEDTGAKTKRE